MTAFDDLVFETVKKAEAVIEKKLEANVLYMNSEIRLNAELKHAVRRYNDTLSDYLTRSKILTFLYSAYA